VGLESTFNTPTFNFDLDALQHRHVQLPSKGEIFNRSSEKESRIYVSSFAASLKQSSTDCGIKQDFLSIVCVSKGKWKQHIQVVRQNKSEKIKITLSALKTDKAERM